jgi:ADP-ribose pyrophosphatase YjhB (NUDIX family)
MTISSRGIVVKDGKILLMYREKAGEKYFSIPGGRIEQGESLEQTVVRELLEETSINVQVIKFLGVFEHVDEAKQQNLFLCKYISGEPKLGDAVEMANMKSDPTNYYKPQWVDLAEVENWKIRPDPCEKFLKEFVKSYSSQEPNKVKWNI